MFVSSPAAIRSPPHALNLAFTSPELQPPPRIRLSFIRRGTITCTLHSFQSKPKNKEVPLPFINDAPRFSPTPTHLAAAPHSEHSECDVMLPTPRIPFSTSRSFQHNLSELQPRHQANLNHPGAIACAPRACILLAEDMSLSSMVRNVCPDLLQQLIMAAPHVACYSPTAMLSPGTSPPHAHACAQTHIISFKRSDST